MQHHPDEFSVTDIRHAMQEAWRIACHRRWYFVFPFCIVSTVALVCSLWVPRLYTAQAVIKREQDPVFASMMGASWTQPYAEIRSRMTADLQNEETISQILKELDLPKGLECFENGELTPPSLAARSALAGTISRSLTTSALTTSPSCDVVAVSLILPEADHLSDILRAIRDRYINTARRRTVDVLRDVQQFFSTESERCQAELAVLHRSLVEYEMRYPGINPDFSDPSRIELTTLSVERLSLERKLDELKSKSERLAERVARATDEPAKDTGEADGEMRSEPNPRFAELTQEITRLQREIAEKKTLRGMTEQHPAIQQLRATMMVRQEELVNTPREVPASSIPPTAAKETGLTLVERLRRQLTDTEGDSIAAKSRLAAVNEQAAEIERQRSMTVEHRQDYLKLRQQAENLNAELKPWQQNIDAIQRIFTVEDRNRTIHFTTVRDVRAIDKPTSPGAAFVAVVCLAIGAAVGVLLVLLTELIDRSYRTAKQLRSSLGIPVIEGIDEIVTEVVRRRRLVRQFVVMPVAVLVCASAVAVAGAMAYLSIENPRSFERLRSAPGRAYQLVQGQS